MLVQFVEMLGEEETSFDRIKKELRGILNQANVEVRRPFCNCLIDICRNGSFPSHRALRFCTSEIFMNCILVCIQSVRRSGL